METALDEKFVPVSFVAKSLGVTPRRVRVLLAGSRLAGRRLENGYWEVLYPFNFVVGKRGPSLQVFKPKPVKEKAASRPMKYIHETEERYQERINSIN